MKFRAKETSYMEGGKHKGEPWIIKNRIYDLIEDDDFYEFKSEVSTKHFVDKECVDEYFKLVSDEEAKMDIDLEKVKEIANRYNIEVKVLPKICEVLGVELEKPFNIKGIACNPCKVQDNTYYVVDKNNDVLHAKHLLRAINDPSVIERIEYNDEQKEIFRALKVLGFNYIVRESDDIIYAYESKPKKHKYDWQSFNGTYMEIETNKILNQPHLNFIDWEDEEPFEIPEV